VVILDNGGCGHECKLAFRSDIRPHLEKRRFASHAKFLADDSSNLIIGSNGWIYVKVRPGLAADVLHQWQRHHPGWGASSPTAGLFGIQRGAVQARA